MIKNDLTATSVQWNVELWVSINGGPAEGLSLLKRFLLRLSTSNQGLILYLDGFTDEYFCKIQAG